MSDEQLLMDVRVLLEAFMQTGDMRLPVVALHMIHHVCEPESEAEQSEVIAWPLRPH